MGDYHATVRWERDGAVFTDNRYSRRHRWQFDGGVEVPASSSPQVVRVPLSDPSAVDPEEAFVASLASCHLLWFLSIAAEAGFVVERYEDEAVGTMSLRQDGRWWMSRVVLQPRVAFAGTRQPSAEEFATLHHRAHDECYIANSVRTEVRCEPQLT